MEYLKGKGAQYNPKNKFSLYQIAIDHPEGLDEELLAEKPGVEVFKEQPKKIISHNNSPDLRFSSSINPYQGCEHGCIYCYARDTHEYWGFSAGLDFESKIVVKEHADQLLRRAFLSTSYKPATIILSGNTDCYQPLEKKLQITRKLLQVFLDFQHPVSIITKNTLILRDLDIIRQLAQDQLVSVLLSITTLDEELRRKLEPRTSSSQKKMEAIEAMTRQGVPVGVMMAPIISGLNHHEIPEIIKSAAASGATYCSYTIARLNGAIGSLFKDWLVKNYPDRAQKVINQLSAMHGGKLNDHTFGRRLKGDGTYAKMIKDLFEVSRKQYMPDSSFPKLRSDLFRKGGNYQLF